MGHALFLPERIGRPAEIDSTCPATGNQVTLRVGPEGPADISPAGAVLAFLLPGFRLGDDTIATFCDYIHFFSSPDAADEWTAERPGTFVIRPTPLVQAVVLMSRCHRGRRRRSPDLRP